MLPVLNEARNKSERHRRLRKGGRRGTSPQGVREVGAGERRPLLRARDLPGCSGFSQLRTFPQLGVKRILPGRERVGQGGGQLLIIPPTI